tara:strand:+ start:2287 stop:2757 length:471 start_codon:yes stop_codon:yes gene_type:complete
MIKRDDFFLNEDFDIYELIENLKIDNYKVKHLSENIIFVRNKKGIGRYKIILSDNKHLVLYYHLGFFWLKWLKNEGIRQKKYFVDKHINKKYDIFLLKKIKISNIFLSWFLFMIPITALVHLCIYYEINLLIPCISVWLFSIPDLIDIIRLRYYCV